MSPRILVAQIGARRRYAVPNGLASAGCLEVVVTDACAGVSPWSQLRRVLPSMLRPRLLESVLDRRIDVPRERMRGLLAYTIATSIGKERPRGHESKSVHWARQNEAFGSAVCGLDWGRADTVYAFNGAALEIFEHARRKGLRCILDQTAAPWRFNTELLSKEQARWPGWEVQPADMDTSGGMIAREEAEWRLADRVVCGSPFVVDALTKTGGPAEKCRIVRYPAPELPDQPRRRTWSGSGKVKVLFAGTLQLRKGIQYVWEAAGRLGPDEFEVRAVGPSMLSPDAEKAIQSRIDWRGRIARHDVWEHYRWADAFLLPTLSEGSANACWEAAAAGLPVITTRAAGVAGAGIIPSADTEAIVTRLLTLETGGGVEAGRVPPCRSATDYGEEIVRSIA